MMNARILLSMARDMLPLAAALGVVALYGRKKPEFAYRPDAGPCFLADGFLVLNERTPKAFPIGNIDRIEYPAEALEGAGEDFSFCIVLRDRKRRCFTFHGSGRNPVSAEKWVTEWQAAGIRCVPQ